MSTKVLRLYNRISNPIDFLYCQDISQQSVKKVGMYNNWKRIMGVADKYHDYESFPRNEVFQIYPTSDYIGDSYSDYNTYLNESSSDTTPSSSNRTHSSRSNKKWNKSKRSRPVTGNEALINGVKAGEFNMEELIFLLKIISLKMSSK